LGERVLLPPLEPTGQGGEWQLPLGRRLCVTSMKAPFNKEVDMTKRAVEKMHMISVGLSSADRDRAREVAADEGRTLSGLIRFAVSTYCRRYTDGRPADRPGGQKAKKAERPGRRGSRDRRAGAAGR
jgi:hypothetical protein